jgi:hypothetical protein
MIKKFIYIHVGHNCSYPGCGTVLVVDGNMKNRRDICYAKDAGYIEFNGLSGSIKTGCVHTPEYKSRYCFQHKIQACDLSQHELDNETNMTGDHEHLKTSNESGDPIAEMIVAKKTTRKQTYYQVFHACIVFSLS